MTNLAAQENCPRPHRSQFAVVWRRNL